MHFQNIQIAYRHCVLTSIHNNQFPTNFFFLGCFKFLLYCIRIFKNLAYFFNESTILSAFIVDVAV